jgi:hypothetical protein
MKMNVGLMDEDNVRLAPDVLLMHAGDDHPLFGLHTWSLVCMHHGQHNVVMNTFNFLYRLFN